MQKYVVERGNGTHKILERQNDGTYIVIGLSAGDDKLANVVAMTTLANKSNLYWNAKAYPELHNGCTVNDLTGDCVDHDSGTPIPYGEIR